MAIIVQKVLSVIMAVLVSVFGSAAVPDLSPFVENGEVLSSNGFISNKSKSREITSSSPVTVNNLVMTELGKNITGFKLEAKVNGEYTLVTAGDTVGIYRYCKFDEVTSDSFRVTVTDNTSTYAVDRISLGYKKTSNSDFKVSSYIRAAFLGDNYKPDAGRFKTTTDLIVIEACTFDETGTLHFSYMDRVLKLMKEVREINPDIRIHLNIIGTLEKSGETWEETLSLLEDMHYKAMRENGGYFIGNIVSALEKYGFDGVNFDWEYPVTRYGRKTFSDFVLDLDKALGSKYYLGAAISAWYGNFDRKAIKAIDNVEVMCYDEFDNNGYHSTFSSAYTNVQRLLVLGYDKKQIHIGLPFYARPTDAGAYWIGYGDYAAKLGRYGNTAIGNYDGKDMTLYFNGAQLIADKTAYALDCGLGGVMV